MAVSRKGNDADLDITPMIDVVFLLLIFFMVTSTMQGTPDLDVPPAKHGTGVDSTASIEIMIEKPPAPGSDPPILIDGQQITMEDIKSVVASGVDQGKTHVVVMADREVSHGFVVEVEKAAMEVEGLGLHVGVKDQK